MYVVREDRKGGGQSALVDTVALERNLSRNTLHVLSTTDFNMRVPVEFQKGSAGDLLRGKVMYSEGLWRYRSDIIVRESCTSAQLETLRELDSLLGNPHVVLWMHLPQDSMLILDNARWMHGRSAVSDPERWLKRVRFHPGGARVWKHDRIANTLTLE